MPQYLRFTNATPLRVLTAISDIHELSFEIAASGGSDRLSCVQTRAVI